MFHIPYFSLSRARILLPGILNIIVEESAVRKALLIVSLIICLLLKISPTALAEIPDFCEPILQAWGATDEKELMEAILKWREDNLPEGWAHLHKGAKTPVSIRLGGTTKELIKTHNQWDVAIVSSKDADLHELAEAGVITFDSIWASPIAFYAMEQWAYPEAVQQKLPQDPLYFYCVYCYSYDPENDEAVFVIWNEKDRPLRWGGHAARQLLERRTPEQVRAIDGFCRKIDWEYFGMPELSVTEDELIAHPNEWDWSFLRIKQGDELKKLDTSGLLYDFSQDEYWANRTPDWEWPAGLWNGEGKLIAIPYHHWVYDDKSTISVFVVNAKSPALDRALAYAKHYIKSFEWHEYGRFSHYSDVEIMRKLYDKKFDIGGGVLLKKDVDW